MSIYRASPVQLKIKAIAIDTFRENVFILTRHCRALRPERLKGSRKVEINAGGALPPEIWTIRKLSILPHLSLPGL
jgi:hypothetical protein